MKRAIFLIGSGFLLVLIVFPHTALPSFAQQRTQIMVGQDCFAEAQWEYLTELRRGPSYNYGITRYIPAEEPMRVFGRNEEGDWFQVYLPEPLDKIGWIWEEDDVKLYGNCAPANLPITTDTLEPASPLDPRPPLPLPDYAKGMEFVEDERIFYLNEGMLYIRHEADELRVHIIVADLTNSRLSVQAAMAATPGVRNGLVTQLAEETGAFVALNGDFYTSSFIPQNLMIIDHEVITAPKLRATFAITEDNMPFLGYFTQAWTWDANVIAENGAGIPLQLANVACDDTWVCLYTDLWSTLPLRQGFNGVRALLSPDYEVLQIAVNEALQIPEGHFVLRAGADTEAGDWLLDNLEIGQKVEINTVTEPDWRDYQYAIGGGPMIVKNGRFWQDCDPQIAENRRVCEEFGAEFRQRHYNNARLARSAVGYNADNHALILMMVEAKDVYGSKGITQRDLADMFIRLGATSAMEFDGGGSSVMWLNQSPINGFPEEGERYVVNALLLFWEDESD